MDFYEEQNHCEEVAKKHNLNVKSIQYESWHGTQWYSAIIECDGQEMAEVFDDGWNSDLGVEYKSKRTYNRINKAIKKDCNNEYDLDYIMAHITSTQDRKERGVYQYEEVKV